MKYTAICIIDGKPDQFWAIAGVIPIDNYAKIANCDVIFECRAYPMLWSSEKGRIN